MRARIGELLIHIFCRDLGERLFGKRGQCAAGSRGTGSRGNGVGVAAGKGYCRGNNSDRREQGADKGSIQRRHSPEGRILAFFRLATIKSLFLRKNSLYRDGAAGRPVDDRGRYRAQAGDAPRTGRCWRLNLRDALTIESGLALTGLTRRQTMQPTWACSVATNFTTCNSDPPPHCHVLRH